MNRCITLHSVPNLDVTLVLSSKNTKSCNAHICTVYLNGVYHGTYNYKWYNRTWELYEGQKVAYKAIDDVCINPEYNTKLKFELDRRRTNAF